MSDSPIVHLVTRSDTIGGVHTHVIDLCSNLINTGQQAIVLVGESSSKLLQKKLKSLDIPYLTVPNLTPSLSLVQDIKCFFALRKLFLHIRPKFVCIHSSKAGVLGRLACLSIGIPCIFTVHGWSFHAHTNLFSRILYLAIEIILQFVPQYIICVSYFDYLSGLPFILDKKKLKIIYNSSSLSSQSSNSVDSDTINLLSVARFDHQKDHITLLHALAIIPSHIPWKICLVGDGPTLKYIEELSVSLALSDRVAFCGFSDNVIEFYRASHIYILSSNWEGLPITILEAMSNSLPIVASNVGGCRELVSHGYNGFLVPPSSELELASAITHLLTDSVLRRSMSRASKRSFDNVFSYHSFICSTFSLYASLDTL